MKKIVKKIGKAVAVSFNKEEQEVEKIKVGDVLDFEIKKVEQETKRKNG